MQEENLKAQFSPPCLYLGTSPVSWFMSCQVVYKLYVSYFNIHAQYKYLKIILSKTTPALLISGSLQKY